MNKTFLIAGGDLRFAALAEKLSEEHDVYVLGLGDNALPSEVRPISQTSEMKKQADYIILPLPVTSDGKTLNAPHSKEKIMLEDLLTSVKSGGIAFGGLLPPALSDAFSEHGVSAEDYAKREEFAVLNAVATAEGAIQFAMEELAVTLSGRKILILGAGRIAKALIDMLRGFHADITVAARKCSDLAWAQVYGCKAVNINHIAPILGEFDIIFNTVPAVILDEDRLKAVDSRCLVIDLASKPGGVDFSTAGTLGVKALWLLSLPGKVAPVTSGEVIAHTVKNILSERGELDD